MFNLLEICRMLTTFDKEAITRSLCRLGEDQVKEIVQKAEAFVLEIRNLLNLLNDH